MRNAARSFLCPIGRQCGGNATNERIPRILTHRGVLYGLVEPRLAIECCVYGGGILPVAVATVTVL